MPSLQCVRLAHHAASGTAVCFCGAGLSRNFVLSRDPSRAYGVLHLFQGVLICSVIMLFISFVGLVGGFTMFNDRVCCAVYRPSTSDHSAST